MRRSSGGPTRRDVLRAGLVGGTGIGTLAMLEACGGGTRATTSSSPGLGPVKYRWRLPSDLPTTYYAYQSLSYAVEKMREYTNGAVDVQVFPNSQFGTAADNFKSIQAGSFELAVVDSTVPAATIPQLLLYQLPYVFKSFDTVATVFKNTQITAPLNAAMEKLGIHVIGWGSTGSRQVIASRPVVHPSDVRGMKIRILPADVFVQFWQAMGAVPTPLSTAEQYTALQQGIIQAADQGMPNIIALKLYEVVKQVTVTNHQFASAFFGINKGLWDSLPRDIQSGVARAGADWSTKLSQLGSGVDDGAAAQLRQFGATVSQASTAEWVAATQPVWEHFASQVGGMQAIEKIASQK